jgi:beta-N-acetylhexosaminidase
VSLRSGLSGAGSRLRRLSAFDWFRVVAAVLLVAALVVALLDVPGEQLPPPEAGGRGAREKEQRSFLAKMIPPPPEAVRGTVAPTTVQDMVQRLPDERKVAQLFLVGFEGKGPGAPILASFKDTDFGGIVVEERNYSSPDRVAGLAGRVAKTAEKAGHVPPLVMAPQDGGKFSALSDLPPREAPADVRSPAAAERQARAAGKALRAVGVNGLLGPVVDVAAAGGPLGKRAYSDDVDDVVEFARSSVRGYGAAKLLAAPKHFPGLGGAAQTPDAGPASVGLDMADLASRDLLPFAAAIEAGVPAVVVGHGSYAVDDFVTPASQSTGVITGLLRDQLGFTGVAIADDLASPAVTAVGSIPDAAVAGLNAGADMLYVSGPRGEQEAAYVAVLNAARKGEISRTRLDQAVLRVLTAKEDAGLIP